METQTLFEAAETVEEIAAVPNDPRLAYTSSGAARAHIEAPAAELTREHPPIVREILRRAGLSMAAELKPAELERAERAARTIGDGGFDDETPAATIRHFIIPPVESEGVTG